LTDPTYCRGVISCVSAAGTGVKTLRRDRKVYYKIAANRGKR